MAHIGTYEYWVQLALRRAAVDPLLDEQNRALAEIDEAERKRPRCIIYYDPKMHTPESLNVGPDVELVARCPYEIEVIPWPELDQLPPGEPGEPFDELRDVMVFGRLEPTARDLSGQHATRKEVRCPNDLDTKTAMMRAFCWPTAVSPYGWPS